MQPPICSTAYDLGVATSLQAARKRLLDQFPGLAGVTSVPAIPFGLYGGTLPFGAGELPLMHAARRDLRNDPDVAAEAANARAICARFLAAHLHPSTSQQGGTPEWTPAFSDSDRPDLQHKANDTTEDSAAFSVAAAHMHSPPTGNASRTHSHTSYSSKSSTVERPNGPGAPSAPALLQAAGQGLPLVGYGGVASQGPGSMDSNRTVAGSSIVSSTRAGDKEGEDAGPNADAVPQPVNAQPDGVQVDGFGRDGCARRAAEGLSFVGGGEEKLGQMVDAKQPDQSSANLANVILSSSSISHKVGVVLQQLHCMHLKRRDAKFDCFHIVSHENKHVAGAEAASSCFNLHQITEKKKKDCASQVQLRTLRKVPPTSKLARASPKRLTGAA
eukprot:1089756-Pelagomonas_calceolata.AAC.2